MKSIKLNINTKVSEKPKDNEENIDVLRYKNRDEFLADTVTELVEEFTEKNHKKVNATSRGVESKDEFIKDVRAYLEQKNVGLARGDVEEIIEKFKGYIWGWGILEPLIDLPSDQVSDISLMSYDNIRVKTPKGRKGTTIKFKNEKQFDVFINFIARRCKTNLSIKNALTSFSDTTSSPHFRLRIDVMTEFANNVSHKYMHIRKIPKDKLSFDKLKEAEMFDEPLGQYLEERFRYGCSAIIFGKGGSGKTSLINAMLDILPLNKRFLIAQESDELFSAVHPEMMFGHVVNSTSETNIDISLKDFATFGLKSDLDGFVIGEIKGAEAYDLVNAAYTGHIAITTCHGEDCTNGLEKMAHYMSYASNMKRSENLRLLASFDILVFMRDFKCSEVVEISGYNEVTESIETIKTWEFKINYNTSPPSYSFDNLAPSCDKVQRKVEYNQYISNVRRGVI